VVTPLSRCRFLAPVFLALWWSIAANAQESWRIVVLYEVDPALPAMVVHNQAFNRVVARDAGRPVEIYNEAFDTTRFNAPALEQAFLALLREKYGGARHVDVVVAVGPGSVRFAEGERARLWPDAPIVFDDLSESAARTAAGKGVTGAPIRFDYDGTFALAFALQPRAKRVVLVGGTSEGDRNTTRNALAAVRRRSADIPVDVLQDAALDATLAALAAVPPDTIVFYGRMFRDGAGNRLVPREALERVAAASAAPVYSYVGTYLGRGIVGGSLTNYEAQGERTARLVLDILRGALDVTTSTPLPPQPPECVVDWRALSRFGLPAGNIPAGCTVIERPPGLWEAYRWHVLGALAVIALQAGLIAALLVQRRRRQQAEHEIQQRRNELAHAARLATVGELTAAIAHEINQPLGAILGNVDAAEMLLEDGRPTAELGEILADIRRDDLRAHDVVQRLRGLLRNREVTHERVDLAALVADVVALVHAEALRRQVEVVVEPAPEPVLVTGDAVQLRQVLLNLLLNAFDATAGKPAGERRVQVCVTAAGRATITVTDNGHGIPDTAMPRLFDSFYSTKEAGMGLGLSIVRTIIEAHAGAVRACNEPQGGATFTVELPLADRAVPATASSAGTATDPGMVTAAAGRAAGP